MCHLSLCYPPRNPRQGVSLLLCSVPSSSHAAPPIPLAHRALALSHSSSCCLPAIRSSPFVCEVTALFPPILCAACCAHTGNTHTEREGGRERERAEGTGLLNLERHLRFFLYTEDSGVLRMVKRGRLAVPLTLPWRRLGGCVPSSTHGHPPPRCPSTAATPGRALTPPPPMKEQ